MGASTRETLAAVRERTGDPTAQPSADELAADQMIFQEVLRRLCIDSGACVVVTDQIGAKGLEEREENELGRVLPMTSGGLEYFVDVMVEASVRVVDFKTQRVFRVIKSNSPAFPIGLELLNPTFSDFLARLSEGTAAAPVAAELPEVPELLDDPALLAPPLPAGPTLDDLRALAYEHGLSDAELIVAARHYCHGKSDLERLTPEEISDLHERLATRVARSAPVQAAEVETVPVGAASAEGRANGRRRG